MFGGRTTASHSNHAVASYRHHAAATSAGAGGTASGLDLNGGSGSEPSMQSVVHGLMAGTGLPTGNGTGAGVAHDGPYASYRSTALASAGVTTGHGGSSGSAHASDDDELDAGSVNGGGGGGGHQHAPLGLARGGGSGDSNAAGAGGGGGDDLAAAGGEVSESGAGDGGGDAQQHDGDEELEDPEYDRDVRAALVEMYVGHYGYASNPMGPLVLEHASRLSHSMIWSWMRAFYDQQGVSAWSNSIVPNFVTSNNFIATLYARMVLGVLKDLYGPAAKSLQLDPSQPLYVVELGAGHGKFSFLLLKKLMALSEFFPAARNTRGGPLFVYVMTDFTDSNLNFWKSHPAFAPFLQSGVLDFATFDCETDTRLTLHLSGTRLHRGGSVTNPILVVANYIFDTLRHDAFRVVDGVLHEGLLTVSSERTAEPDLLDPSLIKRFKHRWTYRPCSTDYYTGRDADLNVVLKRLVGRDTLRNASVLIPVGGIAAIRTFAQMTRGRVIVLAGDKAYNHEEELAGHRDPHIAVHGSFSLMVNFDAVRHYVEANAKLFAAEAVAPAANAATGKAAPLRPTAATAAVLGLAPTVAPASASAVDVKSPVAAPGGPTPSAAAAAAGAGAANAAGGGDELGFALHTPHFDGFKVACFVLGAGRTAMADTRLAFHDIARFGPDDFSILQRAMKEECAAPSMKFVITALRLSGHDSDVFFKFKQFLIDKVSYPYAREKQQRDIKRDIEQVAACYYPLSKAKDVSFEIGRLYMSMKDYHTALRYFDASIAECGDHHVTQYNLGLCHNYLAQFEQALVHFNASVEQSPDYHEAREWQLRMKVQLKSFTRGTFVSPSHLQLNGAGTAVVGTGITGPARAAPGAPNAQR